MPGGQSSSAPGSPTPPCHAPPPGVALWQTGRTSNQLAGAVAAGTSRVRPAGDRGDTPPARITDRRYTGFPRSRDRPRAQQAVIPSTRTRRPGSVSRSPRSWLDEIGEPADLNPDVVAHSTHHREAAWPARVPAVRDPRDPPPDKAQGVRQLPRRSTATLDAGITDWTSRRGRWAAYELFGSSAAAPVATTSTSAAPVSTDPTAPATRQATAHLRVHGKDRDPRRRPRFSNATMSWRCGGYAGFHTTTPPAPRARGGTAPPDPRRGSSMPWCCPTATRVGSRPPGTVGPGWGIKSRWGDSAVSLGTGRRRMPAAERQRSGARSPGPVRGPLGRQGRQRQRRLWPATRPATMAAGLPDDRSGCGRCCPKRGT